MGEISGAGFVCLFARLQAKLLLCKEIRKACKKEGGREERGEESMFRLPYGKGSIEAQAPFRAAVGGRAPVTVKTTVPSQCHHTASWALHWSAAIGMATFCPLGMLSKCQALMRFPSKLRGSCGACVTHSKSAAGGYINLSLCKRFTEHVIKQISPRERASARWAEVFWTPGFHIRLSLRFSQCFVKSPGMENSELKENHECHIA